MSEKSIEINVKKDAENESLKQQLTEKTDEAESLKNKLGIIAEQALDKKRKAVSEKINALIVNPDKRAEMLENLKGQTPEGIKAMELTINTLEEQLSKTKNQRPEVPAGSPLVPQQYNGGQQQTTDLAHTKFPNIETAIATLQSEKKKGNPEAEPLLRALWKRGIAAWKEAGRPAQSTSPDANITDKTTDIPTINFDDPKINDVQGFPQIKKSPYNYSKTHNAAGQLKDGAK